MYRRHKIILAVMIVIMLFSVVNYALTEEITPKSTKDQAKDIFGRLVNIYDQEIAFMEEYQAVWSMYLSGSSSNSYIDNRDNSYWFLSKYILASFPRFMRFQGVLDLYGIDHTAGILGDNNNALDILLSINSKSALSGYLDYVTIAYCNFGLSDYLEEVKNEIVTFGAAYPDNEYLNKLQDFYRATYRIVDFVDNFNIDYNGFSRKLTEFKDARVDLKNDWTFIFAWESGGKSVGYAPIYLPSVQQAVNSAK